MSKLRIFLIFCLFGLIFFKLPDSAFAATCELITSPAQITIPNDKINPDQPITYEIKVADRGANDRYDVILQEGGIFGIGFDGWIGTQPDAGGTLRSSGNALIRTVRDFGGKAIYKEGDHQITVKRLGSLYCSLTYSISKELPSNQQVVCTILGPKRPNSSSDIRLSGNISPAGTYRFLIPNAGNKIIGPFSPDPANDNRFEQDIGQLNPRTYQNSYQILLQKQNIDDPIQFDDTNCLINNLTVESPDANPSPDPTLVQIGSGQRGGGLITAAKFCTDQQIAQGKCSSAAGQQRLGCPGIITAIGCVDTSPTGFIKNLLTFIIGISGGLAFLMMLLGAFQMLTSAGNPDTLNAGRERLTSAAIGLLFVIFSMLLLQIIGFGILNLPGFGT